MNRVLAMLHSRYATIFCIVFAIANRIIFATIYSSIGRDARVQITLAKNLLAGKGMGVTKYFTTNLDHPVFDTTQLFPPGFTLSIVPFLKLFNNEYNAVLAFDIVTLLLFIWSVRLLGKNAGLSTAINNFLTLVVGSALQYKTQFLPSLLTIGVSF